MSDHETAIVVNDFYLAPAAQLDTILRAYQLRKEFIKRVLRAGVDYGTIPGAGDKPALLKAGAEKFMRLYGLVPTFEDVDKIEDWTGDEHNGEPLFSYRVRANLWRNFADGTRVLVGSADGSCNSWEKKYRYRNSERVCPQCGKGAIIKGCSEYGGGWVCFAKRGGCGAKFHDGDSAIEGQPVGQIKNPDIAELVNTILKMAQKRALVAATLITTGASDDFTQDVDDYVIDGEFVHTPTTPAPVQAQTQAPAAAWEKWRALVNEAAQFGIVVHEPPADCQIDDLRAAYGKLRAEIDAARAELDYGADA